MDITMIPMTAWQPTLSERPCATALATAPVQGIAARPAVDGSFAPFAAVDAPVATDLAAVKRDRATTGMDHSGVAAYVPGLPAWSPPS